MALTNYRARPLELASPQEDRSSLAWRSQHSLRAKKQIADWRDHRTADDHCNVVPLDLARRRAAHLAHGLEHEFKAMHVAFGKIAAARIEREPPGGRSKVLEREKLVGLLRFEKAMLSQRHDHAAGEVLIALNHADIGRAETRHPVKVRRDGIEARAGIERRIVGHGSRAISGSDSRTEQVNRLVPKIPGALLSNEHERGRAIIFHAAI